MSALIRTIAFGGKAEACEACTAFGDELVHQSSIYSSTYEAIPFLIEALAVARGGPQVRGRVLALIDGVVDSCVGWIRRENLDVAFADDKDGWLCPRKWLERAWSGSELFARLLHEDGDFAIRTYAAHLLGMLLTLGPAWALGGPPGRYATAIAALSARLQGNEADELVLSSVVFALGRACAHDPSLIGILRKRAQDRTLVSRHGSRQHWR